MEGTRPLPTFLWEAGYNISLKKTQICQEKVRYLGFHLSQGQRQLERKQFAQSPLLQPSARFKGSLEPMASVEYGYLVSLVWQSHIIKLESRQRERASVLKTDIRKDSRQIKRALTNASAQGILDITKPFSYLCMGTLAQ